MRRLLQAGLVVLAVLALLAVSNFLNQINQSAAVPPVPKVETVTTFYVIYVRGCDFLGQAPGFDKTVYSGAAPLVFFPQPGAVNATIYRYFVKKNVSVSGEEFFEERPVYEIRVAGVPCVVNWFLETRELPVRK